MKDPIVPYLMAENNPIKPFLDSLFLSGRATLNLSTLEKAGFNKTKPRKFTKLVVTTHQALPGYLFKLYLDAQRFHKNLPESHFWSLRCQGADKIRTLLEQENLGALFKVPRKWIYPLPKKPAPPKGYYDKGYILVEEDMDILSDRENKEKWASDEVTAELLENLYHIVKELGLHDCMKPDNIPFSKDGRVSFIDTQTFGRKVDFGSFTQFLSRKNQKYWKALIQN